MPAIVLLVVALYVAASLVRPLRPFASRRAAALYGIPGVAALAVVLSLLPPPPSDPGAPPMPPGLTRQQEETRLNKLRGRDETSLDAEMRDAARQPPRP